MEAAPAKKSYIGWIILAAVLLILAVIGILYYYNKDYLNLQPKTDPTKGGTQPGGPSGTSVKDVHNRPDAIKVE